MATSISMCSNALLMIGHGTISSFTEGGAGAEVASNLYDSTYENQLTLSRWRFATAKRALGRLVDTPLNEWTYAFQLPSDYLVAIKVVPQSDYEIYEDKLYSNLTEVALDFVFKPDESMLPPWFAKMMEFALAAQFAIPITDNSTKAEEYRLQYEAQYKKARFIDAQARPSDAIAHSPFTEVRA